MNAGSGSRGRSLLALVGLLLLAPVAALATPVTYLIDSGSAVIRGTLSGQSASIFQGPSSVNVPLLGVSVVYDNAVGSYGRLESFTLLASDFSIDLDPSLVALDSLNVSGATLTSLAGSDLNLFGQFSLPSEITGSVVGEFPGGAPFGPVSITSLAGSGSVSGLASISGDQIIISVVGVTVATFPQLASTALLSPNVEIKADFQFVGRIAPAVPEPSAALLYAMGLTTVSTLGRAGRRRAARKA